jgi:hypothetical protein
MATAAGVIGCQGIFSDTEEPARPFYNYRS